MHQTTQAHNLPLAIFFVIIATIAYAVLNIFVKLALPSVPVNILLFFRFLILLICVLPFVATKDLRFVKTHHFKFHLIRAVVAVLAITFTFISIKYVPLATVVLLSSTEPLFVPFVFRLAKGTPIVGRLYWGIGLGMVGVVFVLHPTGGFIQYAALLPLVSGLCRAISISINRTLTKVEATRTILFYFFLLGTFFTGLGTINSWHDSSQWPWLLIIGVGVSSFVFQLCLTQALRHAHARIITPFGYLAVVFTAFFDWFLWSEKISLLSGIGMLLVIAGAVITVLLGKGRMQARNSA